MKAFKITQTIINRDSEALRLYFRDVIKENMIPVEEEVELASRIRSGDIEARNKLVKANLRFVISIAKRYQQASGLPIGDLVSEGNIGLIKAAEKFDETRGFKFISYAVAWIRQSIMQAIDNNGRAIRLPQNKRALIAKIQDASNLFEQMNDRQPSVEDLADILSIHEKHIRGAINSSVRCLSIDEPFTDGDGGTLLDIIEDEECDATDADLMIESDKILLQSLMKFLTERERNVITKSFGMGCSEMTINDIALDMGLTRERVRQIMTKALRKMKYYAHSSPQIA